MNILIALLLAALCAALGFFVGRWRSEAAISEAQSLTRLAQQDAAAARAQMELISKQQSGQFKQQLETLKAEMKLATSEMQRASTQTMQAQSEAFGARQSEQLELMLKPLNENINNFKTQFITQHASLDSYIRDLSKQTSTLGAEAEALAKALKGNTKLQGNWGEAVLKNLLEATGMTEGRDFTVQQHEVNEQGGTSIPDVVVHLPNERHVIIDSKVSLTAFTEAVATDDANEEQRLLKEHVRSVRAHIKELSAKNYDKVVDGAIGYVLMFIPGEAPYMAALQAEPTLTTEAYKQKVILINPTNLLMALQLAYNLWQSELQSKSVQEIVLAAEKLYKKFATFSQNFVKIGNSIGQLQNTFDEAQRQLATGRGNIIGQLEGWKKKGLTPSSRIAPELQALQSEEAEEEEQA